MEEKDESKVIHMDDHRKEKKRSRSMAWITIPKRK